MESKGLVFFMESDSPVRRSHLATMVMSGVLLDRPVIVVWMGAALARFLADEPPLELGFDDSGTPESLLREARLLGAVTFLACSADAQRLGRDRDTILKRLDDILAMTTILRRIEGAGTVLYL